ncbi:MAG: hypothetical protein K6A32_06315 [Bacteroidales bacterium]|nr:hypothetical protein [Bacteroidales bacterium]
MRNTFFKNNFKSEDFEECFNWYREHMNELPQGLYTIPGVRIKDLPSTITKILKALENRKMNSPYYGMLSNLLYYRDEIIRLSDGKLSLDSKPEGEEQTAQE